MKRSKIFKLLFASLFMIAIVGVFSCTKPTPACETDKTGSVTIYNDFPGVITVDVWSDRYGGFFGETVLGIGMSTVYNDVPAGSIQIWETDAYTDWGYWNAYVRQCENTDFTIYLGKKSLVDVENPLDIGQKVPGKHK